MLELAIPRAQLHEAEHVPEPTFVGRGAKPIRRLLAAVSQRVTIVVADGDAVYRAEVVSALKSSGLVTVVGQAPDGDLALALIQEHEPDIAVVDDQLASDGLGLVQAIRRAELPTSVLVLSSSSAPESLYRSLAHGAAGYLRKAEVAPEEVLAGVLAVHRGMTVLPTDHAPAARAEPSQGEVDAQTTVTRSSQGVSVSA